MTLDRALNEVYRSWLAAKPRLQGGYDREVRHPEIVHRIAARLDLLPPRERVLKVTGSKGKGTTARFAADLIAQAAPGARIALFVSPQEMAQCDRIRLDGGSIPEAEFCAIVQRLSQAVREEEQSLPPDHYVSPVGYYLLVALDWWKRQGADWFVFECGRGARWDDVGRMLSQVAIVTSVLNEHADTLGPALTDIANDKFSVLDNSQIVIASTSALAHAPPIGKVLIEEVAPALGEWSSPRWIADCHALAQRGAERLLGLHPGALGTFKLRTSSASFGQGATGRTGFVFEAAINALSLDPAFIATLPRPASVLACLPDGKDRTRMLAALDRIGAVREIALTGAQDYLHFTEALAANAITIDKDDEDSLAKLIEETTTFVYLVGTQSFIRLVRRALLKVPACSD